MSQLGNPYWRVHDDDAVDLIGPRTDQDMATGYIYTMPELAIIFTLATLFVSELVADDASVGFRRANHRLNAACLSVNTEFKRICRKSNETVTLPTIAGERPVIERGRAYLRNRLFQEIFERTFDANYPQLKEQQQALYNHDLPWEGFFERAYFTLDMFHRDSRAGFGHNYLDRLSDRFQNKVGFLDDDYEFLEFGAIYSTLLHLHQPRLTVITPSGAPGSIRGRQVARQVFVQMIKDSIEVSAVIRQDGSLFDNRQLFAVLTELIAENKITLREFVAGNITEWQVAAAFRQHRNREFWEPVLDYPLAPLPGGVSLEVFLYLISDVALGAMLAPERKLELVKRYALHVTRGGFRRVPTVVDGWALDVLFHSVANITVDELPHIIRLVRNTDDYKTLFARNPNADLWRPLLIGAPPTQLHGTYVSFWLAQKLYTRQGLTKAELHGVYDKLNSFHISRDTWQWIKSVMREVFPEEKFN